MSNSLRSPTPIVIPYVSITFLSLLLLANPAVVQAHGGHGNEFNQENEVTNNSIQVDANTAKRLGIKLESVMLKSRLKFSYLMANKKQLLLLMMPMINITQ